MCPKESSDCLFQGYFGGYSRTPWEHTDDHCAAKLQVCMLMLSQHSAFRTLHTGYRLETATHVCSVPPLAPPISQQQGQDSESCIGQGQGYSQCQSQFIHSFIYFAHVLRQSRFLNDSLHTIPQQISAPSIPHFTFRIRNSAFYREPYLDASRSELKRISNQPCNPHINDLPKALKFFFKFNLSDTRPQISYKYTITTTYAIINRHIALRNHCSE